MSSQTVGTKLKKARLDQKLKLKDIAKTLKIKQKHLEALEKGDIEQLSKEVYLTGYIKSYAKLLDIDANSLLEEIQSDPTTVTEVNAKLTQPSIARVATSNQELFSPNFVVFVLVLIVCGVSYAVWYHNYQAGEEANLVVLSDKNTPSSQVEVAPVSDVQVVLEPLILLAKSNVEITINDNVGQMVQTQEMAGGDTFFLDASLVDHVMVVSEINAVEVFTSDEHNKLLGMITQKQQEISSLFELLNSPQATEIAPSPSQ